MSNANPSFRLCNRCRGVYAAHTALNNFAHKIRHKRPDQLKEKQQIELKLVQDNLKREREKECTCGYLVR